MRLKFIPTLSLAAILAASIAPMASAANSGNIDTTQDATLSIQKFKGVETSTHADGTEITDVSSLGDPLSGIVFDVYKVGGVDVTSNADLAKMKELAGKTITPVEVTAGSFTIGGNTYTLTKSGSITTGAQGKGSATFDLGMYVVSENLGASTLPTGVDASQVTTSAPFLVALPMTNPDGDGWNYNVHVYPKNQVDSITKEVLDGNSGTNNQDGYAIGQNLTYRLTSTINVGDSNGDGAVNGTDLGYYYIEDTLPEGTTFQSASISVDTTKLTADTDYALTSTNGVVKISFTSAGLTKLAANSGKNVQVDIVTEVTTNNATGTFTNDAWFIPSNSWLTNHGNPPGTPGQPPATPPTNPPTSNEVTSKYGDIVIHKTDQAGTKNLSGAVFKVYRATNGTTCDVAAVSGDPVATSAATDANGNTALKGLQLSNFYNGATQTNLHSYCIVESTAPSGYQLLPQPVKFDLTVAGSVTDLAAAVSSTDRDSNLADATGGTLTIKNVEKDDLPLTGGNIVYGLGGLALVAAGGGIAFAAASKRKKGNPVTKAPASPGSES